MSRLLTVLSAQVAAVPWSPQETLAKFEDEVGRFARAFPQAELMVFPELYLSAEDPFAPGEPQGYARSVAEPVPGPLTDRIGKIAARAGRWLVAGSILEEDEVGIRNTMLVFSDTGDLVTTHRKVTPWAPWESTVPGERITLFDIPSKGRIGLMICYEGWFPEIPRGLALAGADVIVQSSLTSTPDREEELLLARSTAIVNQCYVLSVNGVCSFGGGESMGVDPEGRVLFQAGHGEEALIEVLDLDRPAVVQERGTRGLNRVRRHFDEMPPGAFEHYRSYLG